MQAATIVMPRLVQQLATLHSAASRSDVERLVLLPSLAGPDQHAGSWRQDRHHTPDRSRPLAFASAVHPTAYAGLASFTRRSGSSI